MEDILQYFEDELDYMRRAFQEFEKAHPQKAAELGITAGRSTDPNVQRLADAQALNAARLNKRLDDTLPETAIDSLRMVAPSFLLGAPSYGAVFPVPREAKLSEPYLLPRGTIMPVVTSGSQPSCQFTAARDTQLAPVHVTATRLDRAPFRYTVPEAFRGCETVLVLELQSLDGEQPLSEAITGVLEFYIAAKSGRKQRLIDVLSGEVLGLGYAPSYGQDCAAADCSILPAEAWSLSMTADRSTFLPDEMPQIQAVSRLRDFLCYPDKASYFTLNDTDGGFRAVQGHTVELRLFLSHRGAATISEAIQGDIITNAVPVINIFTDQSRPVRYDYARLQVPLKPGLSEEMHVESLQISDLRQLTSEGEQPLPRISSLGRRELQNLPVWQERYQVGNFNAAQRKVSFSVPHNGDGEPETLDFVATLLCSNGRAAFAPRPGVQVSFKDDAIADVTFQLIDEPTMPVLPDLQPDRLWDLLALINGNSSFFYEPTQTTEALKEALNLCAPDGSTDVANAIWQVTITQSVAPMEISGNVLLASGSQIEVVLDLEDLPFAGHVFASALNLFFSSLVSYDRFFQLKVREWGREHPFKVFPRTHGSQICG